jgi:penicillin-binding protein 2
VFADAPYSAGAKTGTAQVVSIAANAHYHANALPTELQDNSLFEAFAPAEHPTIALAVVVENGGWGAQVAGPLARKVLDYYLLEHAQPASTTREAAAPLQNTELAPLAAHPTTIVR